jgi:hypothetical protein
MLKHASPHLTSDNNTELAQATLPGQAHFAGGGPFGATCGGCAHCVTKGDGHRKLHCDLHRIMRRAWGPAISRDANACKYFEGKQAARR